MMKSYTSSYQKLFKATLAATVATGAFVAAVPGVADAATPALKDLDKKQDYYEDVLNLVERGIVKGFPDGTYKPHNSVTRGQAAKILAMSLNLDTTNVKDPGFTDVKKTDEYYGPIAALAEAGIINGYPDNTFGQANTLTRSQMAKIIVKGFELEEEELTDTHFSDVKETDEFAGYVQSLLTNEITKGTTATTFSPANAVSRGQIASFVVRSEKAVANKGTTATLESFTSDSIVLSTGTYALPASLEGLFNVSNEDVLKGAVLNFDFDNDEIVKVNSIEIVANGTSTESAVLDGKDSTFAGDVIVNGDYVTVKDLIVKGNLEIGKEVENSFLGDGITVEGDTIISDKAVATEVAQASADKVYKSLAFTVPVTSANSTIAASGTGANIEFLNANLGKVSVAKSNAAIQLTGNTVTTGLTLSSNNSLTVGANVTVPQVTVEGSAEVTIDGPGKVETLNVTSANANLTLGSNTTIGDLTLPTGTDAKDVINDYDNAKDNIENIDGDTNPDVTPPSTGGGGGGGSAPAPKPIKVEYTPNGDIKNSFEGVTFDNGEFTVPGLTKEFTFIEGTKHKTAKLEAGEWKFTDTEEFINTRLVSSEKEFNNSLEESDVETISIIEDFKVEKPLFIKREVKIMGLHATITKSEEFKPVVQENSIKINSVLVIQSDNVSVNELTIDANGKDGWEGLYALQVYNAKNVKISSYTGRNGDAALLINASEVKLENKIDVSGNKFGGIEVSKGEATGLSDPKVNLEFANILNTTEEHGKPTIWVDKKNGLTTSPVVKDGWAHIDEEIIKDNQEQYYLHVESFATQNVASLKQLKAALAAATIITLTDDIINVDEPLVINRPVTINGGGKKLAFTKEINGLNREDRQGILIVADGDGTVINDLEVKMDKDAAWKGLYAIQVYNAEYITLNDVSLINADGGLLVNGSEVTANNITTKDNGFGGIEVSKGEGLASNSKLTVTGSSTHEDVSDMPAIWVYPNQGELISVLYDETATEQGNDKNQIYYNLINKEY